MRHLARPFVALVLLVSPAVGAGITPADVLALAGDELHHDPAIPTPRDVLGYDVGEWHVRPDQIVRYFEVLAASSDRVSLTRYGETHEQRPLVLATISSPAHVARAEEIRREHLRAVLAGEAPAPDRPLVVWLAYSVHGNEPSGANASLLVAHHLAAARGEAIDALLEQTVILLDPCINPDGVGRFAHWANTHKGKVLVADRAHREHREAWPGGRTNHYWFDLNRDWLLLTHPESRGRIEQFQRWRPNVLTDAHEMETGSTYFFQPGVPSRQNPRTPAENLELTRRIAGYHAEAFDALGQLYYSEERFDDFYYGKGSTYPDVHGSIGILFEQASSRGHLQENDFGPLAFPTTIRNQVLTSLSTLRAAHEMRRELLEWQATFVSTGRDEARVDPVHAYVFGGDDHGRLARMVDLLLRHRIAVHELTRDVSVGDDTYTPGRAFVVPTDQPQYRLLKSLFETRTEFEDETFYDVSTWTLPLSFGLASGEWRSSESITGEALRTAPARSGAVHAVDRPYAYLFEWTSYDAPRALQRLHDADVRARVATRPFEVDTSVGPRTFREGTIVVATGTQSVRHEPLAALMDSVADDFGIDVFGVGTGLTSDGVDLGSPSVRTLTAPRPLVVVGPGVSSYEAGEAWHQLDVRCGLAVALVEADDLDGTDLDDYTHVVMVGGGYGQLAEHAVDALRDWVGDGGVLVASRGGAAWAARHVLQRSGRSDDGDDGDDESSEDTDDETPPRYADYEALSARSILGGAIFATTIDTTHPLGFGLTREQLPVFRTSTSVIELNEDPFTNVARYTDAPLLSGYASAENVESIAGTAAVLAERRGAGTVVRFADDPNFRGVWYGTSRVFMNAIYFGDVVKRTAPLGEDADEGSLEDQH